MPSTPVQLVTRRLAFPLHQHGHSWSHAAHHGRSAAAPQPQPSRPARRLTHRCRPGCWRAAARSPGTGCKRWRSRGRWWTGRPLPSGAAGTGGLRSHNRSGGRAMSTTQCTACGQRGACTRSKTVSPAAAWHSLNAAACLLAPNCRCAIPLRTWLAAAGGCLGVPHELARVQARVHAHLQTNGVQSGGRRVTGAAAETACELTTVQAWAHPPPTADGTAAEGSRCKHAAAAAHQATQLTQGDNINHAAACNSVGLHAPLQQLPA